ncbi:uncharacterized protein SAZU_1704 [Streptomyces azureus]|uniref:Uncharacterized protein n=1 Tax=Streptomyces azureus TaxID=146537 RepID=A0A0K8PGF7_STRAJ|nr:uncharacterized protein SAZU_1704 [Streptomyces azureus]
MVRSRIFRVLDGDGVGLGALGAEMTGVGEADSVADGDADGTAGRGAMRGDADTSGRLAWSGPRRSSKADSTPATAPVATTTEAATTITPRRAARLRSALRAARRWARKPDTVLLPLPLRRAAFPRFGEAPGPPVLPPA